MYGNRPLSTVWYGTALGEHSENPILRNGGDTDSFLNTNEIRTLFRFFFLTSVL